MEMISPSFETESLNFKIAVHFNTIFLHLHFTILLVGKIQNESKLNEDML